MHTGQNLGHEMLMMGLAWWHVEQAPNDEALKSWAAEAKSAKRGLWRQPNPVPPWEWKWR